MQTQVGVGVGKLSPGAGAAGDLHPCTGTGRRDVLPQLLTPRATQKGDVGTSPPSALLRLALGWSL